MIDQEGTSPTRFLFEIPDESDVESDLEFRVVGFNATEGLSSPYRVLLNLASKDEVYFEDVIGKAGFLTILSEDTDRFFHGIVSEFTQADRSGRFSLYKLTLVPSIWLLSLENDCRIFQGKTVPEIVQQILEDREITSDQFAFRLQKEYQPRTYCVQYRESDLNFMSRLLEEEGIFYFFEHAEDKHLLVFGDGTVNYQPIGGEAEIEFHHENLMVASEEFVSSIVLSRRIRSGKFSHTDFNFEQPAVNLMSEQEAGSFNMLEIYDYPGEYVEQGRGQTLANIRLEEALMLMDKAAGKGGCARFVPGFTFSLTDHENDGFNQEYLLIDIMHMGSQAQVLEERSAKGDILYSNEFSAIPSSVVYRPERNTPKPSMEGIQTAIVAGVDGEEIYTDEYGRVKVQFHWDRLGARDENSSCWIRVASTFAGGNYGAIFTPRIGQEVLVDFIEGDPDRPIITGSVYNADNMPPYTLPDEKTKSTVKTNSSIGGEGFNEIRFEDLKGEEEIFIHGEKNQDIRIKKDCKEWIGNDRHLVVGRDKVEQIDRDKHVKMSQDIKEEIGRDRNVKVGGKDAVEIGGSKSLSVGGDVIEVFKAGHSEQVTNDFYVKGMNVILEGMTGLTIKVGSNFITVNSGGIFIKGTLVNINSGGAALSGSAGSAVSPAGPLAAVVAGTAIAGADVTYEAPSHIESASEDDEDEDKAWIEIELVDEDDNPVAGEQYRITLPDGETVATGTTDSNGIARVTRIDPGNCQITFTNLDEDAWEKA